LKKKFLVCRASWGMANFFSGRSELTLEADTSSIFETEVEAEKCIMGKTELTWMIIPFYTVGE